MRSLLLAAACAAVAYAIEPTRLRVEYAAQADVPIDDPNPRFSWALEGASSRAVTQTAYQIVITDYMKGTKAWDSGKVASNRTVNIESKPTAALASDTDYKYTITTWDSTGATGSASAVFSTGLMDPATELAGAKWMSPPQPSSRLFRGEFTLPFEPVRARLYVATGNYFKAFVNGNKVSKHELGTFTTFEVRILYAAVNITQALRQGANAVGLSIGNGWYSQSSVHVGPPTFKAMVTAVGADGTEVTLDATFASSSSSSSSSEAASTITMSAGPSPVVYDDIYIGEVYDATLEQPGWSSAGFSGSGWASPVAPPSTPNATLSAWKLPITVDEDFAPVSISQPVAGAYVVDFGQNMAGFVTMYLPSDAAPGTKVYLSHAEILNPDGTIHDVYRNSPMQANYTVRGTPGEGKREEYRVQFVYMGFRYMQVVGYPGVPSKDDFKAHFVHSANTRVSDFSSSSALMNEVVTITRYAAMSNQMDIPTDCPQRERRGWMGDAQLSTETVLYNFDAAAFYTKFLTDIADSQTFLNAKGEVPDCVPWYHHGGLPADPAWGVAAALIPSWATDYLDDDRMMSTHYSMVKDYVDSELARTQGGILTASRYGDWCSVADGLGDGCGHKSFAVSTYYLIQALDTVTRFATRLGNSADAAHYASVAKSTRQAFVSTYYHAGNNSFANGKQIDLLVALACGGLEDLLPPKAMEGLQQTLVDLFTLNASTAPGKGSIFPGYPSGGIVYTKLFWPVMDAIGRSDLGMTAMMAGPAKPSFGEMINQTATTLWESWNMDQFEGSASRNHIMFGGSSALWQYTTLAGIRRASPSWYQTRIAPEVATATGQGISWVSSSIDTAVGTIESSWDTANNNPNSETALCRANIPENVKVVFKCLGPGGGAPGPSNVFTNVTFASFGTATGDCGSGFTKSTCDSNRTVPVIHAACVGRSTCNFTNADETFGDPCYDVVKHLDVQLAGNCEQIAASHTVTIPVNTRSTVVLQVANVATSAISEGGSPVWKDGKFVPGVPGISGATASGTTAVEIEVGSGSYDFTVVSM